MKSQNEMLKYYLLWINKENLISQGKRNTLVSKNTVYTPFPLPMCISDIIGENFKV